MAEQVGSQIVNIFISIILAAYINPSEFGLFTVISIIASLSYLFINLGFGKSLIKIGMPSEADKNTVLIINLVISLLFSIVLILAAGDISNFFNSEDLKSYLLWVPLGYIFSALGQVNLTLLILELKFKQIFISYFFARIISGGIALLLAINGYGIWSLIIQQVLSSFLQTVFLFYYCRWLPTFKFSVTSFVGLYKFSLNVFGSELLSFVIDNIDKLIVGKYFHTNTLGLYARSNQLTMLPVQNFPKVVDKFLFPYLEKRKSSVETLPTFYIRVIALVIYIFTPVMALIYLVSFDFIKLVFSEEWLQMLDMIKILCFSALVVSLSEFNVTFYLVGGYDRLLFFLNVLTRGFTILAILICLEYGIIVVLWGIFLSNLFRLVILFSFLTWKININLSLYLRVVLGCFLMSSLSILVTDFILTTIDLNSLILVFCLKIIVFFIAYIGVSLLFKSNELRILWDYFLTRRMYIYSKGDV